MNDWWLVKRHQFALMEQRHGETPFSQTALDETGVYHEAVPAPRLTTPDEDATGNGDGETDTA